MEMEFVFSEVGTGVSVYLRYWYFSSFLFGLFLTALLKYYIAAQKLLSEFYF